ncbi:hypothetical protein RUM43_009711 [Polyplax serrata]|uniref:Peptidase S1 domain-containing protein n=1 Tax=Polyplax serrata TaxID=468196 RepID=A0AAN8P6I8_POLSC
MFRFKGADIVVRTGSTKRESGGRVLRVKRFYLNPKYKKTKIDNDGALIELDSPIVFNENSQPIRLADREARPGEKALISGWGSLHFRLRARAQGPGYPV